MAGIEVAAACVGLAAASVDRALETINVGRKNLSISALLPTP